MDVIMGDIGRPTYSPTIGEELTDRSVERVEVCPPHDHRCQGLGPTLSIFMYTFYIYDMTDELQILISPD